MASRSSQQDQDAITWQTVGVRLGQIGLDLRQQSDPTSLTELNNARFVDDKNLRRRDGYLGTTIRDGADYPIGNNPGAWVYGHGLLTDQTNTAARETDHFPTAGRGQGLFRYGDSDVVWTGDRLLVNNENGRAIGSSSFWSADGSVLPYGVPAYLPLQTDSAPPDGIGGDYAETCVTSTLRFVVGQPDSGSHLSAWVVDRSTGALISVTDLGGGTTPVDVRVFASGSSVVCLFRNKADGALYINNWTGNGWTGASNIASDVSAFDVAPVPGGFHLLWRIDLALLVGEYIGATTTSASYAFGTSLAYTGSGVFGEANGNVAIAAAQDGTLCVAFQCGILGLQAATYSSAAALLFQGQLSDDVGSWDGITVSARTLRPEVSSGSRHYPFVVHGGVSGENLVQVWEFNSYNPATIVRTDTKYNSRLASKSFVVGDEVFAWLRGTNSSTNYLIAGALGPVTSGYADREESIERVITDDNVGATAMVSPDPTGELKFTWARPFNTGQTYAHPGNVRIGDLDFLPQLSTAQYGHSVYLSGSAVKTWDGARLLDAGFQEYPVVSTIASDASAGSLNVNGAYQWRVYAVRYNAQGERFQSEALTASHTMGASDTEAVLSIATCPTVEPGVTLEVYRTQDANMGGGSTFYLEGTVSNDQAGVATFTSTMSDADLASHLSDAFATGQLGGVGPIGCSILAAASDRLWGAGGQVPPGYVEFSTLKDEGSGANFDDLVGFLEIDTQSSPITSIVGYNNAINIFQRERICMVADAGPDNLGNGSFAAPQLVLADGAINHVGTATTQAGIVYWGVDGPRLLALNLSVSNISLPIRTLTAGMTPTGVIPDLVKQEVVWFTAEGDGVLLNYLTGTPRWSRWTNLEVAGCSPYALITTDGRLFAESDFAAGDNGVPFAFTGTTGDARPEDVLGGCVALRGVGIVGAFNGDHLARIRVYYNGAPLWTDEFTWEPTENTWLAPGTDFSALTPPQVDALKPVDQLGGYATHKRVTRQHCRSFRVEWSDISADGPTFTPYELTLEMGSLGGFGRVAPNSFRS